jgi:hypothetical protein
MVEIYLISAVILVYLIYNLFVPPHFGKTNMLDGSSLKSLFRN